MPQLNTQLPGAFAAGVESALVEIAQLPAPAFLLDSEHRVIAWNTACAALTGLPARSVIGTREAWRGFYPTSSNTLADILLNFGVDGRVPEEQRSRYRRFTRRQRSKSIHAESWVTTYSGERRFVTIASAVVRDVHGRVCGAVELLHDHTDAQRAREKLELANKVFETSKTGMLLCASDFTVVSANAAYCALTGRELKELVGGRQWLLDARVRNPTLRTEIYATLEATGTWEGELQVQHKNGAFYLEQGCIRRVEAVDSEGAFHYVATFEDVTALRETERRILRLAHYDALTELPNRALLTERLEQAVDQSNRTGEKFGVMFLDLDRFKNINDSLGHRVGDLLLKMVARRLRGCVRSTDTISRQGGDEFVILLANLGSPQNAASVARKILRALAEPFKVESHTLTVTTSIGIATYPDDGQDIITLLKHADAAMYHAKNSGRGTFQYYTEDLNKQVQDALRMENALRNALANNEFLLHYQPQVDLETGALAGLEALVRWQHPQWGFTPPDKFIGPAEELGLIIPLGEWVLNTACKQAVAWQAEGLARVPMSVNLSAVQLVKSDLVTTVRGALTRSGLDPSLLVLEVTESSLIKDTETCRHVLEGLRALGVRLSVDDFGTGYSSLTYLKRFPLNQLKLDKTFVRDVDSDPEDAAICKAIITLAQILKLELVAEGVETQQQGQFLTEQRCNIAQGYLLSPPLSPEALPDFLSTLSSPGTSGS